VEVLTEIPVLKTFVNPLVKTIEETNEAFRTVQTGMQTDLAKQLKAEFPSLSYQPVPLPEPLALSDETVIDVETTATGNQDKQPS
jgi:hypothetical protein